MAKWKIFGKSKSKDEPEEEIAELEPIQEEQEGSPFNEEKHEKKEVLAEHHETLQTSTTSSKEKLNESTSNNQRVWRDVDSIEENVDKLKTSKSTVKENELDKTVDKLLEKNKKK